MKHLLAIASLMTIPATVQAETIYLIIKAGQYQTGIALQSIPMTSMDQCEEAGALIVGSERFDVSTARKDGFECIRGK